MSIPVIAFFNNKGGVGKTTLVYHLAHMFGELNYSVLAADLDPQANLTSAFLQDEQVEEIWDEKDKPTTVYKAIQPLIDGEGGIRRPQTVFISPDIQLLPGDTALSSFEDDLATEWARCLDGKRRAFNVLSAFWNVLQQGANECEAKFILMDLGPNLGSMNRAALIAADFVVLPLGPDIYSLRGLQNLGPIIRRWSEEWLERLYKMKERDLELPGGHISPVGYIVMQHSVRIDRPVKAYEKWIRRIPDTYRTMVLNERPYSESISVNEDDNCIALLKHYRSLMPMSQEAHRPIFSLRPADGAIGAHMNAVRNAYDDFKTLAKQIISRCSI